MAMEFPQQLLRIECYLLSVDAMETREKSGWVNRKKMEWKMKVTIEQQ